MKINLNVVLKNQDNDGPFIVTDFEQEDIIRLIRDGHLKGKVSELTCKQTCISAILSPLEEDNREKKWKKFELWKKLLAGDDPDLKTEEIELLKEAIGKTKSQLVMGQCFDILNV